MPKFKQIARTLRPQAFGGVPGRIGVARAAHVSSDRHRVGGWARRRASAGQRPWHNAGPAAGTFEGARDPSPQAHGGQHVEVEGSFDNWSSRTPLQRSGRDFTIVKLLPPGVYQYKFIGELAQDQPRCLSHPFADTHAPSRSRSYTSPGLGCSGWRMAVRSRPASHVRRDGQHQQRHRGPRVRPREPRRPRGIRAPAVSSRVVQPPSPNARRLCEGCPAAAPAPTPHAPQRPARPRPDHLAAPATARDPAAPLRPAAGHGQPAQPRPHPGPHAEVSVQVHHLRHVQGEKD